MGNAGLIRCGLADEELMPPRGRPEGVIMRRIALALIVAALTTGCGGAPDEKPPADPCERYKWMQDHQNTTEEIAQAFLDCADERRQKASRRRLAGP
jgi:hypothetical protein